MSRRKDPPTKRVTETGKQAEPFPSATPEIRRGVRRSGAAAAFTASRAHPKRLTLDLTAEQHRALKLLSVGMDIPMADILRVLVEELVSSTDIQARVGSIHDERAH